jgi:2-polyprenyl-3-methyl-5-hydroxy-6-metoxy-1,4-benzoquinol methylase
MTGSSQAQLPAPTLHALREQRAVAATAAAWLTAQHGSEIERHHAVVTAAVNDAVERLQQNVERISGGNSFCRDLVTMAGDYLHWLSWTAWDLPQLALVVQPDPQRFRDDLSASVLVYFSGRLLDDYLDRHFLYRARRETLLARLARERGDGAEAEALSVLMSLLLCFEGLRNARAGAQLDTILESARGLLVGILMERSGTAEWSGEFYERLIRLKNVDYWRILYAALDAEERSPLYPFLCRYYALAQKLNDLQDPARDAQQGRPNAVSIYHGDVAAIIATDLLELGQMASELDEPARSIALTKLGESHDEAERLGLFGDAPPAPAPPARLELFWHSEYAEFYARAGAGAFETTGCPICGSAPSSPIFHKQGFAYQRCPRCTHIYVAPRLRPEVQKRLGDELDAASEDEFLQTQKIYADYLCRLLRKHANGPRLLDVGYGSGYLLRTARAHGFDVYGVETSRALTSKLDAMLGRNLAVAHLGEGELPWGSFDVIVMTHVLEHIAEPRPVLAQLLAALNPGGVLYLAVPDSDSWQFRIFGKEWDAVNPVAHYQFFNETSLTHALRESQFESISRVQMPPLKGKLRQRWMNLFRSLGGDESGELRLLGRRPRD